MLNTPGRRLAKNLLLGAGATWVALAAAVVTLSIDNGLPDHTNPLYNLVLACLIVVSLGAVVIIVGHRIVAAVQRLPQDLGLDELRANQAEIIARLVMAAASKPITATVVQETDGEHADGSSNGVVPLPAAETVAAVRRLARWVTDPAG